MNKKLFGGEGHDVGHDNTTDMRGENPDYQRGRPLSSPAFVLLRRMRDGYDLIQPRGSGYTLIRLSPFDLIQTHANYVQELVAHGYIEVLESTAYTRAGWLCYGLSPTGRRHAQ